MSEVAKIHIGGFQVIGELPGGEGGQGVIYIAKCVEKQYDGVEVGDQVAIKVMTVQDNDGKQFQKLNTRTAALTALHHPGILKYHGCLSKKEVFNYYHFVIMEYLHGQTLKQKITANHGGVDGDEAKRIIQCCLDALAFAESKNIIHRDLTPSNIFVCDNGDVKLIDFEVAKTTRPTEQTNSTGVFGKLDYMAPELFLGSKETPVQSDIFSFCLCIHEAFTGNLPYERGSVAQAKGDIKIDEKLRSLVVGLDEILVKGLAVNPTDRYPSFHDLSEAFKPLKLTTWEGTEGRRYQALKFIGAGGFGWVYKANMLPAKQLVAIKYLLDIRFTDRFEREAEVLKRFDDDRIVQFIDYFTEAKMLGGHGFLVMNFLDGMPGNSLRDRLKKIRAETGARAGLPHEEALVAFIRFAEGLALMHQATVYHRDLKPSNLYFPQDKPHQACIMDLGVARNEEATLTHMGHVPGTLDYMPPEFGRAEGGRGSAASDVYAFGLCLYEALTGRFPLPRLPAGSQAWLTYLSRSVSNPPRAEFKDEMVLSNPALKSLLERMIEPDISKRLSNMEEIVEVLKSLLNATPGKGSAFPPSKPVRGLKPKSAKTTVIPLPEAHEGEEGETERTLAADEQTLATMAAKPEELQKLKKDVRADVQVHHPSPEPKKSEPPAKPIGSSKPNLLSQHGKKLGIAAAVLFFLSGSIFLFQKPISRLFDKPMSSVQMKQDASALSQLLATVNMQRLQIKKEIATIQAPADYKAYTDKVADLLMQLTKGASPYMKVSELEASPELMVQYFAYAEKTNQVSELSDLAQAQIEGKAQELCELVESAYTRGDTKEAERLEALRSEWKDYLPQTVVALHSVRIKNAKKLAEQRLAQESENQAKKRAEDQKKSEEDRLRAIEIAKLNDLRKAEDEKKSEEDRLRAIEIAKLNDLRKAEAERLKAHREEQATISARQRADLAKGDELRNEALNAYMQGDLAKGDAYREDWIKIIKNVKDLISEQLRQNQADEMAKAREDITARVQKSELAKRTTLLNESSQRLAKIETIYGQGTQESLVSGAAEYKRWQDFAKEKKLDDTVVAAGEKRTEQALLVCKGKVAAGLLKNALASYKAGEVSQADALANDWQKLGVATEAERSQLAAGRAACEDRLKATVDWAAVMKREQGDALNALKSQELDVVNSHVTKLAEAIAKAKATGLPVIEATQVLQKLNMYRVVLASPVRVTAESRDRRVTVEYQDEAKQWQPISRNSRVSPGKVLFRFNKPGYKSITQEVDILPGKNNRVNVPQTWDGGASSERRR
jgi:serine/threonine protein kinase